jgi:hypothetical protein
VWREISRTGLENTISNTQTYSINELTNQWDFRPSIFCY